jgi:hypothetical protein
MSRRMEGSEAPPGAGSTGSQDRKRPKLKIVVPNEATLEGLVDFSRRMWDPEASPRTVRSWMARAAGMNPNAPGELPPTLLLLRDHEVIGYVSTIPVRLWLAGGECPAYFVKGLTVLPEYRNGPGGFLLLREVTSHLPYAMCMTAGEMLRGLFARAGYREIGALRNHLRLLRSADVLARLDQPPPGSPLSARWRRVLGVVRRLPFRSSFGAGVDASLRIWSLNARGRGTPQPVDPKDIDPGELERLWRRSRAALAAAPVRDSAYLVQRYLQDGAYAAIELRRSGRLEGMAFLRRPRDDPDPRLQGITVASLSDAVISPQPGLLTALMRGAEGLARDLGAHAILFSASHRDIARAAIRRAYIPLPGNVYTFFRDRSDPGRSIPPINQWWLTRGDGLADEVL